MRPELFRIGSVTIYSYGTLLAIALFAGLYMARVEFRRRKMDPDAAYDLALAIAIGGIFGARLFYVVGHWSFYAARPLEIIQIQKGGLVFYGGLVFGGLGAYLVARYRRLPILKTADSLAAPLALGQAIGRIGCFLQGCCYGVPTASFIGVNFFDVARHPTQLYELVMDLAIFLVLLLYVERSRIVKADGSVFLVYLMLYSFGRFWLEFLRVSPHVLRYFTGSQLISAGVFAAALYFLVVRWRKGRL